MFDCQTIASFLSDHSQSICNQAVGGGDDVRRFALDHRQRLSEIDESGDFATILCNRKDVDLEPVTNPKDIDTLHRLITRHLEFTSSRQAKRALKNWEATLSKFVKVFPHEYKRVLGIPRIPAVALVAHVGTPAQEQVIRG